MDVKTTFLNGDLQEKVYINQPKGFVSTGNDNIYFNFLSCIQGLGWPLIVAHDCYVTIFYFIFIVIPTNRN